MESILDAMRIVGMIMKDLEQYVNLADKAAGWDRIDPSFERSATMCNCYQTTSHSTGNHSTKEGKIHAANGIVALY